MSDQNTSDASWVGTQAELWKKWSNRLAEPSQTPSESDTPDVSAENLLENWPQMRTACKSFTNLAEALSQIDNARDGSLAEQFEQLRAEFSENLKNDESSEQNEYLEKLGCFSAECLITSMLPTLVAEATSGTDQSDSPDDRMPNAPPLASLSLQLQQAMLASQAGMQRVMLEATDLWIEDVKTSEQPSLRSLYNRWVDHSESVYAVYSMTDEFQQNLGKLINAAMAMAIAMESSPGSRPASENAAADTKRLMALKRRRQSRAFKRAKMKSDAASTSINLRNLPGPPVVN